MEYLHRYTIPSSTIAAATHQDDEKKRRLSPLPLPPSQQSYFILIVYQVRTICQLSALAVFTLVVVWSVDKHFRVLPSALHNVMPAHHPGLVITDITVATCSRVNLFSSCNLDSPSWHRIDKDLYLGKSWVSSAYVDIQRKREEELLPEDKVIVDVSVGRLDPSTGVEAEADESWEKRPAGLWLKRSLKHRTSDSDKVIMAVDVLFGADAVDPEMAGRSLERLFCWLRPARLRRHALA